MFSSPLPKHCWDISPPVTLLCFLGFRLLLEKNTDGTLEPMCSGLNWPWTFWPDLLQDCTSLKDRNARHLCWSFAELLFPPHLSLYIKQSRTRLKKKNAQVLINEAFWVSKQCASMTSGSYSQSNLLIHVVLHGETSKWACGQRPWDCESHCD